MFNSNSFILPFQFILYNFKSVLVFCIANGNRNKNKCKNNKSIKSGLFDKCITRIDKMTKKNRCHPINENMFIHTQKQYSYRCYRHNTLLQFFSPLFFTINLELLSKSIMFHYIFFLF